jgi:hypothetical protein
MREQGWISSSHKSKNPNDLDEPARKYYFELKKKQLEKYNSEWCEILSAEIAYKKPYMGNGDLLSEVKHPEEEQLYVFPCFIRPGR